MSYFHRCSPLFSVHPCAAQCGRLRKSCTVHHRAALPRNIRRPRFWYLLVDSGLFQGCFKVAPHIGFVDVGQWKTFYYKNADPEVAEPSLKWVNRGTWLGKQ